MSKEKMTDQELDMFFNAAKDVNPLPDHMLRAILSDAEQSNAIPAVTQSAPDRPSIFVSVLNWLAPATAMAACTALGVYIGLGTDVLSLIGTETVTELNLTDSLEQGSFELLFGEEVL